MFEHFWSKGVTEPRDREYFPPPPRDREYPPPPPKRADHLVLIEPPPSRGRISSLRHGPTWRQIDDDVSGGDGGEPTRASADNAYSEAMRGIAPKRGRAGAENPRSNKRPNTNGSSDRIGRTRDGGAGRGGQGDGFGGGPGGGRGGGALGARGDIDAPLCPGHNEECVLRTTRKEVKYVISRLCFLRAAALLSDRSMNQSCPTSSSPRSFLLSSSSMRCISPLLDPYQSFSLFMRRSRRGEKRGGGVLLPLPSPFIAWTVLALSFPLLAEPLARELQQARAMKG